MTTPTEDYTHKERRAINRAWSYLIDAAEQQPGSAAYKLQLAHKLERRARSCQATARALICRNVLEAARDRDMPLRAVHAYAAGLVLAAAAGMSLYITAEVSQALEAGIEAHDQRQARWLERV